MNETSHIATYPVGFFRDVQILNRRLRHPGGFYTRRQAFRSFAVWFGRSWRRRSYWNGFLAEWHYCPEGVRHTRCGRGWTRRAALRRLGRHIVAMNLAEPGGSGS